MSGMRAIVRSACAVGVVLACTMVPAGGARAADPPPTLVVEPLGGGTPAPITITVPTAKDTAVESVTVRNTGKTKATGTLRVRDAEGGGMGVAVAVGDTAKPALDLAPNSGVTVDLTADGRTTPVTGSLMFERNGSTTKLATVTVTPVDATTIGIDQADANAAITGRTSTDALELPLTVTSSAASTVAVSGFLTRGTGDERVSLTLGTGDQAALALAKGRNALTLRAPLPRGGDYKGELVLTDPQAVDHTFTLTITRSRASAPFTVDTVDPSRTTIGPWWKRIWPVDTDGSATIVLTVHEADGAAGELQAPTVASMVLDENRVQSGFTAVLVDEAGEPLDRPVAFEPYATHAVRVRLDGPFIAGVYSARLEFPNGEQVVPVNVTGKVSAADPWPVLVMFVLAGLVSAALVRWVARKLASNKQRLEVALLRAALAEQERRPDLSTNGKDLLYRLDLRLTELDATDSAAVADMRRRIGYSARWLAREPLARTSTKWAELSPKYDAARLAILAGEIPKDIEKLMADLDVDLVAIRTQQRQLLTSLHGAPGVAEAIGPELDSKLAAITAATSDHEMETLAGQIGIALLADLDQQLMARDAVPGDDPLAWQARRDTLHRRILEAQANRTDFGLLAAYRAIATDAVAALARPLERAMYHSDMPDGDRSPAIEMLIGAMDECQQRNLVLAVERYNHVRGMAERYDERLTDDQGDLRTAPVGPVPSSLPTELVKGEPPAVGMLKMERALYELLLMAATMAVAVGLALTQLYSGAADWGDASDRAEAFFWAFGINIAGAGVGAFVTTKALLDKVGTTTPAAT